VADVSVGDDVFCGRVIVVVFVVNIFTIRSSSVSLTRLCWDFGASGRVIRNRQRGNLWRNLAATCAGNAATGKYTSMFYSRHICCSSIFLLGSIFIFFCFIFIIVY